jgi:hypothetical protein
MAAKTSVLDDLIHAAYKGPVFGPHESFGHNAASRVNTIQEQIKEIGLIFNNELSACIHTAIPKLSDTEIQQIIKEIGPKAVAFCPALTAGELVGNENLQRLARAACAIGVMYFADQSMDRGDELMPKAIEALQSSRAAHAEKGITARLSSLGYIQANIKRLALPEDTPIVLDCFNHQVLYNEVLLHNLSLEYMKINKRKRTVFLTAHADQIARLMVVDAGFPSVTSSLYAIYRQNDPNLLPLSVVHNDEAIVKLLQICNTVVRIADEVGDWEIDAGHHPQWGVFSINPFNQYHPAIITKFCELASINDSSLQLSLQAAFRDFHTDTERHGSYITTTFFNHARDYINNLSPDIQTAHSRYILLCKRVLEIGHVNMMGDKALADTDS